MSNFSLIDGSIVGLYLVGCMTAGIMARKYVGKVDQFLVAGREMNLYLGIASLAATEFGITTCMYSAELGFKYGFSGATPGITMAAAMLFVGWTGFCIKPLRDAGVITIPELFQRQFGSRVRWLSGVVIVLGGLLNMGVFLRVGGEFLVRVTGLHHEYLEITMTLLLLGVAAYTILGGMVSVLITDYLQFIVMSVGLLIVTIMIFVNVGWDSLVEAVQKQHGPGGFSPFLNNELDWDYVIFYCLLSLAVVITWQTTVQRVLAAKDSNTAQAIYRCTSFFFICRYLLPCLWGIAALTTLAPEVVSEFLADTEFAKARWAMPLFLGGGFIPVGIMGILIAAMLAADMSSNSSYMLTWGSVIYNDILAPFHKNKWSQRRGLLWNRSIIALIGVFLLFYGLWYEIKGNVMDYLAITGTIYLASMSVLLISACYWQRANNWGATAAIVVGAVVPLACLVIEQCEPFMDHDVYEFFTKTIGRTISGILTYVLVAAAMVIGSWLKAILRPKEVNG